MGESLGRWRARGTLHHGGRPRGRDSRAHRPPLHPPPPNSHPEALVLPTTGHSLAIGTPIDSIYLNRGGAQWCSEQGWGAGGRLQSTAPPPAQPTAHEGWPYLICVARQVRGQLLGLHVPHFQRAVTAAADQEPAVGRPRDLVHGSHMATQGGQVPGPGGKAIRMDVRSRNTSEGSSRPPAVVLNCGCMSGLPGNLYKISLPGPRPTVI